MVYRSARFLPEFIRLTREAVAAAGFKDYEIVFVNDGSPDDSLEYLLEQRRSDPRLRVVELSRNFGHHRAALAGLACAAGENIFLIDCDLEVSPMVLVTLASTFRTMSADVVYGVQHKRKGGFVERVGGQVFWKVFNLLSDTPVPANVLTERLMTRAYRDALLSLGDRNIFLAGMMYWTGFHQVGVPLEKGQRTGRTTYSLAKRVALLFEAITSFSTVPLKLVLGLGLALTAAAAAFAAFLVVQKLLNPESLLMGFTSIAVLIIGTGGIVITLMGVLGLYISRIFVQTQGRPTYIVREIHGKRTS